MSVNNKFQIKNVICFYVTVHKPITDKAELSKKDKEDYSYEDYLTEACLKHKYNIHWLNKWTVRYTFNNGVISIDDDNSNEHFSITADNKWDTIIFQGQANDNISNNYVGLMKAFELLGMYMFNTINPIEIASNKYLSANLLSAHGIPQPRYVLITHDLLEQTNPDNKNDISICPGFEKMLDYIYDSNVPLNSTNNDIQYVVKILGGSLGIGVFICNRSEITSILQTIFAIDEKAELIIQQFKENTGDIRVHVFSVDGKNYEILAAMKRNKISGDFRSNVSLGATTDKYELTKEQENIVLNVAHASGCKWVGVDLMECKDNTNVVIEYNSSPGVQGISKQIHKNMFNIIFDKIEDNIDKIHIK